MKKAEEYDDAPADDEPTLEDYQAAAAVVRAEQAEPEPEATPDEPTDDDKPSRREAKYRVQLREAEAERDGLRANVEAMQRAEVERLAGASIRQPNAIWAAGVDVKGLLDDEGRVDPIKVASAVQDAQNTLGLAATRPAGFVRGEGQLVGQPVAPAENPWQKAFTGPSSNTA
jgi:hypothetical protein